jgi:hypothetical protein
MCGTLAALHDVAPGAVGLARCAGRRTPAPRLRLLPPLSDRASRRRPPGRPGRHAPLCLLAPKPNPPPKIPPPPTSAATATRTATAAASWTAGRASTPPPPAALCRRCSSCRPGWPSTCPPRTPRPPGPPSATATTGWITWSWTRLSTSGRSWTGSSPPWVGAASRAAASPAWPGLAGQRWCGGLQCPAGPAGLRGDEAGRCAPPGAACPCPTP